MSAKRKQVDILQKITACSAWQYDLRRGYLWSTSDIFYSTPGITDNLQFSFRGILKLIHPDDRKIFLDTVKNYIQDGNGNFQCDIQILMECGGYRWVEVIGTVDQGLENEHDQLAGIAIDISRRKKIERQLKLEAMTDPLTGANNRRSFLKKGDYALKSSRRYNHPLSFLMMDVDHFKAVNDTYGHHVGDQVLKALVLQSKKILRDTDLFGRLGGEEFGIILPETDTKTA